MSKKYKIGQVLYIISPQTQAVIPVQIQEINQRTTIDGEETIYMVMDPDGQGLYNLDEINGRVYINSSDVSKFLKDNASKAIDGMVKNAVSIAQSKFGSSGGADDIFASAKKKTANKSQKEPNPKKETKTVGEINMVEVVDKKGKSKVTPTRIRSVQMPGEEPIKVAN